MKKRLYDLLIKMVSVKGLGFLSFFIIAIITHTGIEYAFYSLLLLVGGRTVEKYIGIKK